MRMCYVGTVNQPPVVHKMAGEVQVKLMNTAQAVAVEFALHPVDAESLASQLRDHAAGPPAADRNGTAHAPRPGPRPELAAALDTARLVCEWEPPDGCAVGVAVVPGRMLEGVRVSVQKCCAETFGSIPAGAPAVVVSTIMANLAAQAVAEHRGRHEAAEELRRDLDAGNLKDVPPEVLTRRIRAMMGER